MRHNLIYHILAFITISIWGTTFISTKVLLLSGFTPSNIFLIRFVMAYIMLCFMYPSHFKLSPPKTEFQFFLLGITGGSMYFYLENSALVYTFASNVSLIVTTAPLLTAIAAYFFSKKEVFHRNLWIGAIVAFFGVALVVFNGNFVLHLSPIGDILAILAALMWTVYSILFVRLNSKYPYLYITRKIFFYGVLTILPVFLFEPLSIDFKTIVQPKILFNFLFLGIAASSACYAVWNKCLQKLGSVRTSNYIFFNPLVTLITSYIVLDETITVLSLAGAALIFFGVYLTSVNKTK